MDGGSIASAGTLSSGLVVEGVVDLALAQTALTMGDRSRADLFAGRVVDSALHHETPVFSYDAGTWGPERADRIMTDEPWHNPSAEAVEPG